MLCVFWGSISSVHFDGPFGGPFSRSNPTRMTLGSSLGLPGIALGTKSWQPRESWEGGKRKHINMADTLINHG